MSEFVQLNKESQYLLGKFVNKYYSNMRKGQKGSQAKMVALTLDDAEELIPQARREDLKSYVYKLSDAGFRNNEPIEITWTSEAIKKKIARDWNVDKVV